MPFKTIKQWLHNKQGNVLILFALMLPVILALMGLVIDGGRLFTAKADLQGIADTVAAAGSTAIADEIVLIIEEKKAADPDLEIPADVTVLLGPDDIIRLKELESITATAQEYFYRNNINNFYNLESDSISYPFNPDSNSELTVKVTLSYNLPLYFAAFLGLDERSIQAEAFSSIKIAS